MASALSRMLSILSSARVSAAPTPPSLSPTPVSDWVTFTWAWAAA